MRATLLVLYGTIIGGMLSVSASNPPVAAFSFSHSQLTANFTDQSTENPTNWLWDFGDGNTSSQQHPVHTYAAQGQFIICLIVANACGSDSLCQVLTIMCPPPFAGYSYVPNNLSVVFSDLSANAPTQWLWDFGDGNTSSQQSPTHNYAAGGTYTVCQTVSSGCGTDSTCKSVTVTCAPPAAAFTQSGGSLTIDFTDQSANNPYNWTWDFGDGNQSALPNPSHAYAAEGVYTVCLTVTNACGTDSTCTPIEVACLAPQSAFSWTESNLTYAFTDLSANEPSDWHWTFGDGAFSKLPNPTHTYPYSGTFEVCLQTENACGADTACETVVIVGVGESRAMGLLVFPNPAGDVVWLETAAGVFDGVSVRDLSGRRISVPVQYFDGRRKMRLELAGVAAGTYFLEIATGGQRLQRKIQVRH